MGDWDNLSPEHKIKALLELTGDERWGWVAYRTCYKPELETAWEAFKSLVDSRTRQRVARSDAPDIAGKMDWAYVEDRKGLDGTSRDELRSLFQKRARAENPAAGEPPPAGCSRGSRHAYFLQVDEPALRSLCGGRDTGDMHVNIVRGWDGGTGEADDGADWMKLPLSKFDLELYVELDNDESWFNRYTSPEDE